MRWRKPSLTLAVDRSRSQVTSSRSASRARRRVFTQLTLRSTTCSSLFTLGCALVAHRVHLLGYSILQSTARENVAPSLDGSLRASYACLCSRTLAAALRGR